MSSYTTCLKDLICNAVQRKSDGTNIIKAVIVKLAFQFKFTRGNNKNHKFGVKIWVFPQLVFMAKQRKLALVHYCNINTFDNILTIFFLFFTNICI